MNNTIVALQNLYVAMGGELTDTYDDICDGAPVADLVIIPDMINAIASVAGNIATSAKTSELPAVTAADNGKVLKVADGAWSVGNDATE